MLVVHLILVNVLLPLLISYKMALMTLIRLVISMIENLWVFILYILAVTILLEV
jgi:hypothetical protein